MSTARDTFDDLRNIADAARQFMEADADPEMIDTRNVNHFKALSRTNYAKATLRKALVDAGMLDTRRTHRTPDDAA